MGSGELVVERLEVGVDGCRADLRVVGVVDVVVGEDLEGRVPVVVRLVVVAECAVGVGEAVVGTGLVGGLAQFGGEVEGGLVAGEGVMVMAQCVVSAAEALVGFELAVAVADRLGDARCLGERVDGVLMAAV